jgi:hypothetical protein
MLGKTSPLIAFEHINYFTQDSLTFLLHTAGFPRIKFYPAGQYLWKRLVFCVSGGRLNIQEELLLLAGRG